jgi:hypothetical protein
MLAIFPLLQKSGEELQLPLVVLSEIPPKKEKDF